METNAKISVPLKCQKAGRTTWSKISQGQVTKMRLSRDQLLTKTYLHAMMAWEKSTRMPKRHTITSIRLEVKRSLLLKKLVPGRIIGTVEDGGYLSTKTLTKSLGKLTSMAATIRVFRRALDLMRKQSLVASR